MLYIVAHECAHALWWALQGRVSSGPKRFYGIREGSTAGAGLYSWEDRISHDLPARKTISKYAAGSFDEAFAEAFAMIQCTPQSTWPPVVAELHEVLQSEGLA
jgi:hypothetical protein